MALNNVLNAPIPFVASKGGTGVVSPTIHGILVAQGASAMNPIVLAAGQVLIGTTASDPAAATLTAGTGISISSVTGAITISSTLSLSWVSVSGTSQTLAAETGYFSNNMLLTTYTLPVAAAVGDTFEVVGPGAWLVAQNAGQSLVFGSSVTTTGVAGSLAATNTGDCVRFVCSNASTGAEVFRVLSAVGNLTVI